MFAETEGDFTCQIGKTRVIFYKLYGEKISPNNTILVDYPLQSPNGASFPEGDAGGDGEFLKRLPYSGFDFSRTPTGTPRRSANVVHLAPRNNLKIKIPTDHCWSVGKFFIQFLLQVRLALLQGQPFPLRQRGKQSFLHWLFLRRP